MRKIKFDEATISSIRQFINEGHTLDETCNKFTLKYDTLRRVMYENNIQTSHPEKRGNHRTISEDDHNLICQLYEHTNTSMADIVRETKLPQYVVQDILDKHFSKEFQNKRKSKLYRQSKLGDKNPMTGRKGELHPNYKGLIDDGQGYLMIVKPDWYTGRAGSDHVFYHSVVMAEHLGLTEIPAGFVVHHIDGNKHNNDISNLALMTLSAHSKLHMLQRNLCKVQRLSRPE